MYKIMRVLFVIPAVVLIGLIVSTGWAHAQQAPTPTHACDPCISHQPTPADEKRLEELEKKQDEYCKAHPRERSCVVSYPGFKPPSPEWMHQQDMKIPGYYTLPEPGHDTACYRARKDPPDQWVCIPDTWWGKDKEPEYGHCYTNPKNPSEQRCVPTREQQMQAEGSP